MKLTAELTAEQVVTNLLSSHEILKKKNEKFSATNFMDLGGYLEKLSIEESYETDVTPSPTLPLVEGESKSKYAFIKEGGWKF